MSFCWLFQRFMAWVGRIHFVANAEIVSIGTELLLGQILDSDAPFLAQHLSSLGISVFYRSTVGDNRNRIADTLRLALSRADIVICVGGLGPTQDDLTRDVIADVMRIPLVRDDTVVAGLSAWFTRRGIVDIRPSIYRQADIPLGGVILPNAFGTAPGLWLEAGGKLVIALPGPPSEFEPMVTGSVLPSLRRYLGQSDQVIHSQTLRLVGMGEAEAESLLLDLMQGHNPSVAPYAKQAEVHLRVTASAGSVEEAEFLMSPVVQEIMSRLGSCVYSINGDDLETTVVQLLGLSGETVATAESCTGGLLAGRLTAVPGSSTVFETGVVAYANQTKVAFLDVRWATLHAAGAVSSDVAGQMALGIQKRASSTYGIGITGIAGPGGGDIDKPVGLVYIGLAHPGGVDIVRQVFTGDRNDIRVRSTQAALGLLRTIIIKNHAL